VLEGTRPISYLKHNTCSILMQGQIAVHGPPCQHAPVLLPGSSSLSPTFSSVSYAVAGLVKLLAIAHFFFLRQCFFLPPVALRLCRESREIPVCTTNSPVCWLELHLRVCCYIAAD
jgi:hypothetical protein